MPIDTAQSGAQVAVPIFGGRVRGRLRTAVGAILFAASINAAHGETAVNLRSVPTNPQEYVDSSLKLIESGADRTMVLDVLVRIALHDGLGRRSQQGAVNAVFHLAKSDNEICDYLLQVITSNRDLFSHAQYRASQLIPYVADAKTRTALLAHIRRDPTAGSASICMMALRTLGDEGLAAWLRKAASDPTTDALLVQFYASQAREITLQQNPAALLEYIRSGDESGRTQGWAVYYSVRHGTDAVQLKNTILHYVIMAKKKGIGRSGRIESALRAGVRCGLFDIEDLEILAANGFDIHALLDFEVISNETIWPYWAARIREKRQEFTRIDAKRAFDDWKTLYEHFIRPIEGL